MNKTIELDKLLQQIESNFSVFLPKENHEKLTDDLYTIVDVTKNIFLHSASVPEMEFANSLFELLCQLEVKVHYGFMTDEELTEYFTETDGEQFLEMFINPTDLFLGGKIRPDVVFRKGVGKYVIFEIDSFQYHSSQEQLMSDKIRERKIQSLGHPVFRFSAKEVLKGRSWSAAIEAVEILNKQGFINTVGKPHG